jgi:putative ABC transport system ATP-binding protein
VIELRNVSRVYLRGADEVHALEQVSLEIPAGRYVALMGPSGSGKSTLLNILAGLDRPSAGQVTVAGRKLDELSEDELAQFRAAHMGFVFQFFNLIPVLSARENVELPLLLTSLRKAERRERAQTALRIVGLSERADHMPAQLSGGEQQRVAIARAIAKQPSVLLCDEPTGALDSATGVRVLEAIKQVNDATGATTLLITHNAAVADMADRVVIFSDGQIREQRRNSTRKDPQELSW